MQFLYSNTFSPFNIIDGWTGIKLKMVSCVDFLNYMEIKKRISL